MVLFNVYAMLKPFNHTIGNLICYKLGLSKYLVAITIQEYSGTLLMKVILNLNYIVKCKQGYKSF